MVNWVCYLSNKLILPGKGEIVQNNYTDTTLIEQLCAGDEAAFAFIFQKYHQAVLANISKLIHHQHEAEDILQEVFITLWQSRHKLTQNQSIAGWLFTTSYYKSLEHLRKAIKQSLQSIDEFMPVPEEVPAADFEKEYADKLTVLHSAIESLPQRKRSAFTLCRLEGKTYEEAAAELGISKETVKEYVKSSVQLLREYVSAAGNSRLVGTGCQSAIGNGVLMLALFLVLTCPR